MYPLTEACVCYITRTCSAIMSASAVSTQQGRLVGRTGLAASDTMPLYAGRLRVVGVSRGAGGERRRSCASSMPQPILSSISIPRITPETHYHLRTCMGILHDLPQVHTAYDTRATQHATRQVTSSGRAGHERFLARWQQPLVRHARLVAASTLAYMFGLGVCGAVGETRESQAGLPACDSWQQTQEDA